MSKGYVKKSAEEKRKEIEALTKDMDKRVGATRKQLELPVSVLLIDILI